MKSELLTALRSTKGFVSGQELCEKLGVSRTAVWKGMKKLKSEGYNIEAVSNKGYRLLKSPDIIDADNKIQPAGCGLSAPVYQGSR